MTRAVIVAGTLPEVYVTVGTLLAAKLVCGTLIRTAEPALEPRDPLK